MKARDCKDKTQGKTGIVYDERMIEHRCLWDSNYPERPERFTEVLKRYHQQIYSIFFPIAFNTNYIFYKLSFYKDAETMGWFNAAYRFLHGMQLPKSC